MKLFKLKGCSEGLDWLQFLQKQKTKKLLIVLIVSTPAFVLLDDFIFKRLKAIFFSTIRELFSKPRFLLHQGDFAQVEIFPSSRTSPQAKSFPSSRTFSTIKHFYFIMEVFLKQRYSVHQGSFQQVKAFPSWRKLSTSKDFSFIKEVFHKQSIFLCRGSFLPQPKIFLSSRKFFSNKDNPFIKEGFYKPRLFPWSRTFSISKGFFMIMKVLSKQSLIFQAKIVHPYNTFIQYSKGISNEMSNKNPKH